MAERRTRRRRRRLSVSAEEIVQRVLRFFDEDLSAHALDMDLRLQRYAKFRMWTEEGKNDPWPDSSDAAVPDMMTHSQRTQDTLYNAVLTQDPPLEPKAVNSADANKESQVGKILHHQFFVENMAIGDWLGDLIDSFVNDGHFTAYVPWVQEHRQVQTLRIAEPIPEEMLTIEYFLGLMQEEFGQGLQDVVPLADVPEEAWDFQVQVADQDSPTVVRFYTGKQSRVEMQIERASEVFNGPKVIIKDRSEVLHPARVANLQIPGPSNPDGSSHVIFVDHPSLDEIKRLRASGFYDRVTADDLKAMENVTNARDPAQDAQATQRDIFQGADDAQTDPDQEGKSGHKRLTRLMCFDTLDTDGDGIDEDVIFWVIKETETLLKDRALTEMFPMDPPRRPIAEEAFIPVPKSRTGIGVLEMLEGVHDLIKQTTDQMIDLGSLLMSPFWFYRHAGATKPEVIRLSPGEGYPFTDPKNDVHFPTLPNQGGAFAINHLTLLNQQEERLTLESDLNFGRVPAGKSSALRTTTNMAIIAGQSESRPERVLRRLFSGIAQIYSIGHQLNKHFLPDEKKVRVAGYKKPGEDGYLVVKREDLKGQFDFTFKANVFNSSRAAAQQALGQLLSVLISPITIQLGITDPDRIHNLLEDFTKSLGQDPERYLKPPVGSNTITAEEAIGEIMDSRFPEGVPFEPPEEHFGKLQTFAGSDEFGLLSEEQVQIFTQYGQQVTEFIQQQRKQALLAQAAEQFGGESAAGGGQPTGAAPDTSPPPVQANELIPEDLPTSGGGAQQ